MSPTNPNEPNQRSEQLSAYLDGQLAPEERLAFEKLLQSDDKLLAEKELQEKTDASLKRSFVAPVPSPEFLARLESEGSEPKSSLALPPASRRNERLKLAFFAIAASVVWGALSWSFLSQETGDYEQLALQVIYEQSVESGFQPKWVCEDDHEFAKTFQDRQGQALLMKPLLGGSMVGLSYLQGLTRNTTTMLAEVEGEPILVFIDRLEKDTQPAKPSWGSGLNLFRKELSGLVLYEITPLDEPRVIDSFYPVEVLPESSISNKSAETPAGEVKGDL